MKSLRVVMSRGKTKLTFVSRLYDNLDSPNGALAESEADEFIARNRSVGFTTLSWKEIERATPEQAVEGFQKVSEGAK